VNKIIKGRILLWILDGQSESGLSIVLNVQLGETGEKIMESPVVNLTIWPFSKDPRKIPNLLNKCCNSKSSRANNELLKTVRTIKFTFTVQFSLVCIENDNIIGIRHGKRPWTTLQELRGQYRMTRISYVLFRVNYLLN